MTQFQTLQRLAERLLDADVVLPETGECLLTALAEVRAAAAAGDGREADRLLRQWVRRLEATLAPLPDLPETDAALAAARKLLEREPHRTSGDAAVVPAGGPI